MMKDLSKKNILFCDHDGKFSVHSDQELKALGLNSWKGWKCSAGITNLHITSDGNMYTGTCKVGGLKGNIFDTGVVYPDKWITCTKEWCTVVPEMQLFKSKIHNENVSYSDMTDFSSDMVDPIWVGPTNVAKNQSYPLTISWNLGRRCNYQCSYCPPTLSNTFEVSKSFGSLKFAIDNIQENFCKDKKALWIFTGGEPTINPSYMQMVKYLHLDLGHIIHTESNGSLESEYFTELIEYSSIGFSAHPEQFNRENFINNVSAILNKKASLKEKSHHSFTIRIMVKPNEVTSGNELKKLLMSLPNAEHLNEVTLGSIQRTSEQMPTMNYSDEEQKLIDLN